ncbi:uncharacterized protein METZ01_LOCUS351303 [marine metagenome]|uniref:Uncharacterized protein n=1 Tax=marine metagenome TaxID=408172 RepID=A0A382RL92_9ZZZZ
MILQSNPSDKCPGLLKWTMYPVLISDSSCSEPVAKAFPTFIFIDSPSVRAHLYFWVFLHTYLTIQPFD